MKNITLILILALTLGGKVVSAQSQRLVFLEEFTQASCPPCASYNPGFNTLMNTNASKATSLKLQTSWPGTDPMNAQNAGEVQTRVTYYGVSGVPDVYLDGVAKSQSTTQANIDADYAVPSPFSIDLKYWFNGANDSVFVNCEITCTQNVTLTTPRVRIAMEEKTITFSSPPGTNGEKDFYNVMRKMYPDAAGTALAGAWTNGQKKTLSFKGKIPTYVYKKTEIAFVAWIQDDAGKSVKQSAFSPSPSAPLALPPVADFLTGATSSCDGIFKFMDQSALFPTSWAWDFGDGGTSSAQNPTHKYNTAGTFAVKLTAANANGNNSVTKAGYVTVTLSGTAPGGVGDNICSFGVANLSASTSGSGTLNWYDQAGAMVHTGTTYAPNIVGTTDFWVAEMTANAQKSEGAATNAIGAGTTYTAAATQGLVFDVQKSCILESVMVYASSAGNRTIEVLDAGGNVVKTGSFNIPNGQSTVNVNFALDAGTGYTIRPSISSNLYRNTAGGVYPYNASSVVKITGNTAGGTSAAYYYFFYDWKVRQNPCASPSVKVSGTDTCTSTGIYELNVTNSLAVSPNPSNGVFNTSFNTATAGNYTVKISNTLGQVVYEEALSNFSGKYSKEINIESFGKGVYMLSISDSRNEDVKKVITY